MIHQAAGWRLQDLQNLLALHNSIVAGVNNFNVRAEALRHFTGRSRLLLLVSIFRYDERNYKAKFFHSRTSRHKNLTLWDWLSPYSVAEGLQLPFLLFKHQWSSIDKAL